MKNFKQNIFILIALLMIGAAVVLIIVKGDEREAKLISETKVYTGDISELYLEVGACQVEIKKGPAGQATVQCEGVKEKTVSGELKNGALKIKHKEKNKVNFDFFGIHVGNSKQGKAKIILTIPENMVFEKCVMDFGAAKVTGEQVLAEELVVSVGVGDLDLEELFAGESAAIEVGVGSINVSNANLTNASLDCGTGEITMNGKIFGKSEIDCGVGDVELRLTTKEEEYRGELDCGIGKIIFGEIIMKSGDRDFGDAAAENRMDIDCGIGKVSVKFE